MGDLSTYRRTLLPDETEQTAFSHVRKDDKRRVSFLPDHAHYRQHVDVIKLGHDAGFS